MIASLGLEKHNKEKEVCPHLKTLQRELDWASPGTDNQSSLSETERQDFKEQSGLQPILYPVRENQTLECLTPITLKV